jgi:hypothetical protein
MEVEEWMEEMEEEMEEEREEGKGNNNVFLWGCISYPKGEWHLFHMHFLSLLLLYLIMMQPDVLAKYGHPILGFQLPEPQAK